MPPCWLTYHRTPLAPRIPQLLTDLYQVTRHMKSWRWNPAKWFPRFHPAMLMERSDIKVPCLFIFGTICVANCRIPITQSQPPEYDIQYQYMLHCKKRAYISQSLNQLHSVVISKAVFCWLEFNRTY